MSKITTSPTPCRAAIYIRVSTEEQHLNGLSLPAQRMALEDYATKNGYTTACAFTPTELRFPARKK